MILRPSEHPGSHERHLLRKAGSPLFTDSVELSDDTLLKAQQLDHDALGAFQSEFRNLLQAATALGRHVDSDTVLQLKDRLDKAYETSATVAGDQKTSKEAIRKLLHMLMHAIRNGANGDAFAQTELDQEETARETHFTLLESQLVADLLDPHSPIHADELIPTLLSSAKEDLVLAVQIFDEMQLLMILTEGSKLLEQLKAEGIDVAEAEQKLALLQGYSEFVRTLETVE